MSAPAATPDAPTRVQEPVGGLDRMAADVPLPAALLGLLGVYLLGVGSGLYTAEGSNVPLWWPAAGLAVAMLLLTPPRSQWLLGLGVALATAAGAYTGGDHSLVSAVGFGVSSGVEASVVAWLVGRGQDKRPALRTMEQLWRFLSATLAGNVVAALGIGLTLMVGADGSFTDAAVAVIASHAAAILLVAPLVMRLGPFTVEDRFLEAVLEWLLLLFSVNYIFSPGQSLSLSFLPLPLLLWAALRFGVRTVAYQLLAIGVVTTTLTARGGGPFAAGPETGVGSAVATAFLVQAFLIVTALIALPLAVAVEQRRTALTRVSASEELFHKSFSESFVGMMMLSLSRHGLRIR